MNVDNGWRDLPAIFILYPTYHEFWSQVLLTDQYAKQIYDMLQSINNLKIVNDVVNMSQYGYGYTQIREYVIEEIQARESNA